MIIQSDVFNVTEHSKLYDIWVNESNELFDISSSREALKANIYFAIGLVFLIVFCALFCLLFYHGIKNF